MIRGLASLWTVGILLLLGSYFTNYMKQSVTNAAMEERDRCNQTLRSASTFITEEDLDPTACVARFNNKLDIQNCQLKWLNKKLDDELDFLECEIPYFDRLCASWWTRDLCKSERTIMNAHIPDMDHLPKDTGSFALMRRKKRIGFLI